MKSNFSLNKAAIIAAVAVLIPISSYAGISPLWQVVGSWQIRVDQSVGNACFMLTTYEDGSLLRIGFDRLHPRGYIMVANENWRSIEIGKEYPITLRFDNDTPWRGDALATTLEGGTPTVLELSFHQPGFLLDLARKQALYVAYEGKPVVALRLSGSVEAVEALLQCERQFDQTPAASGGHETDPIATSAPQQASDPFR